MAISNYKTPHRRWTSEDDDVVRDMYTNYSNEEIGIKISRTSSAVEHRGLGLGLRKDDRYVRKILSQKAGSERKYNLNDNFFDTVDNIPSAYFLGFLWADGHVSNTTNTISMNLQEKDKYILDMFSKEIEYTGYIKYIKPNKSGGKNNNAQYKLSFCSRHMKEILAKYGIVPNKTYLASSPDHISNKYLSHFVRGVFDGDGCISMTNKKYNQSLFRISGTPAFCQWLKVTFNSIGLSSYVYKQRSNYADVIHISKKKDLLILTDWIYNDSQSFKLERKYERFVEYRLL